MGSYVTQTRALGSQVSGPCDYFTHGVNYHSAAYRGFGDNEVTTSYRSGRSEKSGKSSEDPLAFNPHSDKEAFAIYKRQYEDQKRSVPVDAPKGYPKDNFVDTGHTFSSVKKFTSISHPGGFYGNRNGSGAGSYSGPLCPDSMTASFDSALPDTTWYQTRAIALTAPTNPAAHLATFLGELKADRPPSMIGQSMFHATNIFRSLGEEYLNIEFGWKPFISDLHDLLHSVMRAHKLTAQYERDSGRIVRRRHTFPPLRTTTSGTRSGWIQAPPNGPSAYWQGNTGQVIFSGGSATGGKFSKTTLIENWFSGAYSYYLQRGNSHLDRIKRFEQKVNHLFGTRLTPDVLWELAPWSWLADWNGNIGTNLTNASLLTSDGLVIRYGYFMTTKTVTETHMVPSANHAGGSTGPISCTLMTITKNRTKANPYGFGSNPAAYTSRQWSILAALGMTKTPNSLR